MIIRKLARLYPRVLRNRIAELITYAHIKLDSDRFLGFILVANIIASLVISLFLNLLFGLPILFIFFGLLVLTSLIIYFWLVLQADAAAKFVETVLPDALQLMASNLRSGLTTDKAFMLSSRPEFGLFKEEIDYIGKEIATGKEIGLALRDICKKINSQVVERAIDLIVSGLRSGGGLAELLEQTARDLRKQEILDKKIRSNVHMYVIFVFIAVAFGTPILFGLSSFLVETLKTSFSGINLPEAVLQTSALPLNIIAITVSNEFLLTYIVTFLITSSFFGGLIIGAISKGREKEGLKSVPVLLALNMTIFFLVRFLLITSVGSLTP